MQRCRCRCSEFAGRGEEKEEEEAWTSNGLRRLVISDRSAKHLSQAVLFHSRTEKYKLKPCEDEYKIKRNTSIHKRKINDKQPAAKYIKIERESVCVIFRHAERKEKKQHKL